MDPFTTLIDADTLARHLGAQDLVLFDCRFDLADPGWGEREYVVSHLPGAHYLHLDRDLSAPIGPQTGRHPLPDPLRLARTLAAHGVDAQVQLVAYDQGNGMYAARLWWLARWIGLTRVAVLDGGFAAWRTCSLPLTPARTRPQPANYAPQVRDNVWLGSAAVDQLRQRPGHLLIDARAPDRFAGRNEPIDPVAGHVPGARNHPIARNLGPDGRFLPTAELRARWTRMLGSRAPEEVIAMCGSGVTACHTLLALEHAGLPGGRLYAGSWSEWIRDPQRPVARGSF